MIKKPPQRTIAVSDGLELVITPDGIRIEVTEYHPKDGFVPWHELLRWYEENRSPRDAS